MIFKWFDTKDVDALADRMADELRSRMPPASVGVGGKKEEAKQHKTHDMVLRQAHDFASSHALNVYTKARLANRFKWALLEAGYGKEFVDELAYKLAAVIAAAR